MHAAATTAAASADARARLRPATAASTSRPQSRFPAVARATGTAAGAPAADLRTRRHRRAEFPQRCNDLSPGEHGTRQVPLHRRRGTDRRRQDQPRAAAGRALDAEMLLEQPEENPFLAALLPGHAALMRCRPSSLPVPARRPVARPGAARPVPRGRRSPISCSTRTRCSRGSTCPTTSTRSTRRSTRTEAAGADARPGDLPAGAGRYAGRAVQPARRGFRAPITDEYLAAPGRALLRASSTSYDDAPRADRQQRAAQFRRQAGRTSTLLLHRIGEHARPARILQPLATPWQPRCPTPEPRTRPSPVRALHASSRQDGAPRGRPHRHAHLPTTRASRALRRRRRRRHAAGRRFAGHGAAGPRLARCR